MREVGLSLNLTSLVQTALYKYIKKGKIWHLLVVKSVIFIPFVYGIKYNGIK